MERLIPGFMTYLMQVKNASKSTMSSYERDLKRLAAFLDAKGVHTPEDVTATSLNSYILFLEREGFSTATVSRNVASMKSFFHYVCDSNRRLNDPTSQIRAPHIDRKAPEILSVRRWKAFWSSRTRGQRKESATRPCWSFSMPRECG